MRFICNTHISLVQTFVKTCYSIGYYMLKACATQRSSLRGSEERERWQFLGFPLGFHNEGSASIPHSLLNKCLPPANNALVDIIVLHAVVVVVLKLLLLLLLLTLIFICLLICIQKLQSSRHRRRCRH